MKNERLTKKDIQLIKGAIRRVFSRSDLRKKIIDSVTIEGYNDPERPRVKKWGQCRICNQIVPRYTMQVDHVEPLQPIGVELYDMTADELINRAWCIESNLQAVCKPCHMIKSKQENALRRKLRKEKSNGKST